MRPRFFSSYSLRDFPAGCLIRYLQADFAEKINFLDMLAKKLCSDVIESTPELNRAARDALFLAVTA
jgi:hypothetical protein